MAATHERDFDNEELFLRQRLLRRIGTAGVLIIALVASLAIFDSVFVAQPAPEEKVAVPVTPPPADSAPAADKPADSPPAVDDSVKTETPPAPDMPAAEPPSTATPAANSADQTKAGPKPDARVVAKPISRPPAVAKATPAAVPEESAAPTMPQPKQAPIKAEPAPVPAPVQALSTNQPTAGRQPGYLVQMGVFSNVANAEELKSRLDKAGIPSRIEARVQVGPFKNKLEAETAQKKLAEMGLSGILLSPRR